MKNNKPIQICGEIGINHNSSMEITKKLIDIACIAGFTQIKFQKRTPDICVPEHQKDKIKDTPWGKMTYLEYKYVMEFEEKEYKEIDAYCKEKGMKWFASAWDLDSAKFLKDMKCDLVKIPSAHLTNDKLLTYCRKNFKEVHMSTGMSTEEEIVNAVKIGNPDVIYHTNSSYPCKVEDLNLGYIKWLKDQYPEKQIGFSNHFFGIVPSIATTLLGIKWIEVHITLDRTLWGSDQMSSVEPTGMIKLVKGVRDLERAIEEGYGPRYVYYSEQSKIESLKYQKKPSND